MYWKIDSYLTVRVLVNILYLFKYLTQKNYLEPRIITIVSNTTPNICRLLLGIAAVKLLGYN